MSVDISITSIEQSASQSYTVYCIRISSEAGILCDIKKRFNDFHKLHSCLQNLAIVAIDTFHFPPKYFFNTSEQVIEERKSSFERYLVLLMSLDPFPREVEQFLGLLKVDGIFVQNTMNRCSDDNRKSGGGGGEVVVSMTSKLVLDWSEGGHYFKHEDRTIFYCDSANHPLSMGKQSTSDKVVVLLHGFPTFSLDYVDLFRMLSSYFRVITLDFLGSGLSDKPKDLVYTFNLHADCVESLLASLMVSSNDSTGGTSSADADADATRFPSIHVIAHDIGVSVGERFGMQVLSLVGGHP